MSVTQEDLDTIALSVYDLAQRLDQLEVKVDGVSAKIQEDVRLQTEANEKLLAELFMAYQEMASTIEVALWKLWGNDLDESADFQSKLEISRKQLIGWIQQSAKASGTSEQDITNTLANLFPPKSASPK